MHIGWHIKNWNIHVLHRLHYQTVLETICLNNCTYVEQLSTVFNMATIHYNDKATRFRNCSILDLCWAQMFHFFMCHPVN